MSKALIRLRAEPKMPKRGTVTKQASIEEGYSFGCVMAELGCSDPDQVRVSSGYWDDEYNATYTRPMTDEEWKVIRDVYLKKKAAYDEWYEENKDLIAAEKKRRRQKEVDASARHNEQEKKRLKKALAKLEK